MADPLSIAGGVVGIVAFAQQLAESAVKVRAFCKDVKNAPKEVEHIINQANHLNKLLRIMAEDREHDDLDDQVYNEGLEMFHSAVDQVFTLVSTLETRMKTKRRAKIETVLQEKAIQSMLQKVDRSILSLQLAHSALQSARWRQTRRLMCEHQQQAADERKQLLHLVSGLQIQQGSSPPTDVSSDRRMTKRANKQSSERTNIKVRLPSWLWQVAWDISFERAAGHWTMSLQAIVIIPWDHEVWRMCETCDIAGINYLLDQREITLHTESDMGTSLFSHAIKEWQTELAVYLLEHGANMRLNVPGGHIHQNFATFFLEDGVGAISAERARRHLHTVEDLFGQQAYHRSVQSSSGEPMTFLSDSWTDEQTLSAVCNFAFGFSHTVYDLLGGSNIKDSLWFVTVNSHFGVQNLITFVAQCWRMCVNPASLDQVMDLFSSVIRQGVKAGADLHSQYDGPTPLVYISGAGMNLGASISIRKWVTVLSSAGVDLSAYGATEQRIWRSKRLEHQPIPRDSIEYWAAGVLGFASGPEPTDWWLWTKHPGDLFAGILWEMLEHPERCIPGSWEDTTHPDDRLEYFEECAIPAVSRAPGMKAKTIRHIRRAIKCGNIDRSSHSCDAKVMTELCELAIRNAGAWRNGTMTDVDEYLHWGLLKSMEAAGMHRGAPVGIRRSRRDGRMLW